MWEWRPGYLLKLPPQRGCIWRYVFSLWMYKQRIWTYLPENKHLRTSSSPTNAITGVSDNGYNFFGGVSSGVPAKMYRIITEVYNFAIYSSPNYHKRHVTAHLNVWRLTCSALSNRAVKIPWIFPVAPLTANRATGNSQGNSVRYDAALSSIRFLRTMKF